MTQTSFLDNEAPRFGGTTFDEALDGSRLSGALSRVYSLMADGQWRTLAEISEAAGCTEAGASARLRDMRKDKFRQRYPNRGVERQNVGGGLWKYRLEI